MRYITKFFTPSSFLLLSITVMSIFLLSSCDVINEEDPQASYFIKLTAEDIGHEYVSLDYDFYLGKNYYDDAKLFYDTIGILTDSTPFIIFSMEHGSNVKLMGLKPGKMYYLKSQYVNTKSNTVKIETLPAEFSCQPSLRTVVGDFEANQYGFNGLVIRNNRLTSVLMGDFTKFELYLPKASGTYDFEEGVYTTINDYVGETKYRNSRTAIVTFTAYGDTVYYAKVGQPISVKSPGDYSSELVVEFCDMVFVSRENAKEITLSGKLN